MIYHSQGEHPTHYITNVIGDVMGRVLTLTVVIIGGVMVRVLTLSVVDHW
jgi:hypothetical protein